MATGAQQTACKLFVQPTGVSGQAQHMLTRNKISVTPDRKSVSCKVCTSEVYTIANQERLANEHRKRHSRNKASSDAED